MKIVQLWQASAKKFGRASVMSRYFAFRPHGPFRLVMRPGPGLLRIVQAGWSKFPSAAVKQPSPSIPTTARHSPVALSPDLATAT
ncbi:hypothetical protein J6590_098448 [Homalodisca vitripennis]|nr:hypothetical protein J6590_033923 [Homalodisca vitripennis]KAG8334033.1 hypothetical protein J6590_098448 [Homalodisca vitripennis]